MTVQRTWSELAGHDQFNVVLGGACAGDADAACARLFANALEEVGRSGFASTQIVRSRIWARSAELRQSASNARLKALAVERRAASASFIAPERLPAGIDVLVDLVALSSAGRKQVREYAPQIAPPMFVTLENLVFVSGVTDTSDSFDAQLDRICAGIAANLSAAGAAWSGIVRADAYIARRLDWSAVRNAVCARFPCSPALTSVEGYSAPQKLIEIEVTCRL